MCCYTQAVLEQLDVPHHPTDTLECFRRKMREYDINAILFYNKLPFGRVKGERIIYIKPRTMDDHLLFTSYLATFGDNYYSHKLKLAPYLPH